jgi:hypothetical protein
MPDMAQDCFEPILGSLRLMRDGRIPPCWIAPWEPFMRTIAIVTTAIVLVAAGAVFMLKSNTGPTYAAQTTISTFGLMVMAKDLPVAENPDAF